MGLALALGLLPLCPHMRTLLLTAVLLGSFAALGQDRVDLQFSNQGGDSISVGAGDCALTRTVSWTANGAICNSLTIWATSGSSCGNEPAGTDVELADISASTVASQRTGTVSFDVGELPFPTSDAGGGCGGTGFEQTFRICGAIVAPDNYGTCPSSTSYTKLGALTLTYDALAPGKPKVESVDGLDNALLITVSAPSGATEVLVEAWLEGSVAASLTQSVDNGTFRLRPLQNGVLYEVHAYALDAVGNRSEVSDFQSGTPVNTRGFYEEYLASKGQDMGGCGAAGGGLVGSAMLAVMGLWLFSRRGRS